MLEAGEAVHKAKDYLNEIMPEFVELNPHVDEMEFSQAAEKWKIVFSAKLGDDSNSDTLGHLIRRRVVQKIVEVGASDGSFISVKNFPF